MKISCLNKCKIVHVKYTYIEKWSLHISSQNKKSTNKDSMPWRYPLRFGEEKLTSQVFVWIAECSTVSRARENHLHVYKNQSFSCSNYNYRQSIHQIYDKCAVKMILFLPKCLRAKRSSYLVMT